jgi:hypothetical protein
LTRRRRSANAALSEIERQAAVGAQHTDRRLRAEAHARETRKRDVGERVRRCLETVAFPRALRGRDIVLLFGCGLERERALYRGHDGNDYRAVSSDY